jgi:hypothetical protein
MGWFSNGFAVLGRPSPGPGLLLCTMALAKGAA